MGTKKQKQLTDTIQLRNVLFFRMHVLMVLMSIIGAIVSYNILLCTLRMHGINKNYTVPLSNGSHSNLIIMWMGATTTILSLVFHKCFNHTSHNCYVERMQILDHLIIRVENLYSVIFAVTMWIILIPCYSFLWTIWRRWCFGLFMYFIQKTWMTPSMHVMCDPL